VSDEWRTRDVVRIGLKVGAPDLLLAGSSAWKLETPDGNDLAHAGPGEVLRIRQRSGSIDVTKRDGGDAVASTDPDDTLLLVPERGYAGWSGRWYRGTFRVYATPAGPDGAPAGLTLVNEVPLEDYLRGVLPEEIGNPPATDFEAVKAQAVAARTYTLSYLSRRADLGFDLWATVEDQVYGGTARENAQASRAVQETRGEILLSDGVPIRALYSSACGGRTSNVEDVWPWPWTSYLRSVRDAEDEKLTGYCSLSANYRWKEEWPVDQFVATLRKYAPAEGASVAALDGQLLDVRIEQRSRSGRVALLVVETTEGDCVLHGDRTRWALRRPGTEAILRSSFFKIGIQRAADGAPLKVIASGGGNGHGIGMCQWGAMGMARAGKNYREILRHYYKDTQLAHL
jgi:stage II sporulation protein D